MPKKMTLLIIDMLNDFSSSILTSLNNAIVFSHLSMLLPRRFVLTANPSSGFDRNLRQI
jgi:hypothetical protein